MQKKRHLMYFKYSALTNRTIKTEYFEIMTSHSPYGGSPYTKQTNYSGWREQRNANIVENNESIEKIIN